MPKGMYDRSQSSWRPPPHKDYKDIADDVRRMYGLGMTIQEIADAMGRSTGVIMRAMKRNNIPRRSTGARNSLGENNPNYRGDEVGYQQLHKRVIDQRGRPSECAWCGVTSDEGASLQWANITGNYWNVWDFARLCLACHHGYDSRRRAMGVDVCPLDPKS